MVSLPICVFEIHLLFKNFIETQQLILAFIAERKHYQNPSANANFIFSLFVGEGRLKSILKKVKVLTRTGQLPTRTMIFLTRTGQLPTRTLIFLTGKAPHTHRTQFPPAGRVFLFA
jgi:hypothetical protein